MGLGVFFPLNKTRATKEKDLLFNRRALKAPLEANVVQDG